MGWTIRIDGVRELQAQWKAGHAQLVREVQQAASHAGHTATQRIMSDVPVKTGALQRSVKFHIRRTANGANGAVTIGVKYAKWVLEGTKTHPIRARGKWLRFFWERAGYTFVGREVNHPGTKANDYLTAGVEDGQRTIEADANAAVMRLKRKIEGA